MALVVKDRVKETTTTTGTGTYTLGGAVTGFETFTSNLINADTTYYVCTDGTDFEVGIGTFTSSGTTLARTTILASSNSNNAVSWSSGTREIFITYPADKAVFKDASNNINGTFVGNITGNVTGNTSGSSGSTTGNAATATALETARTINGTSFDGTGNITVTAAAGTLTGSTLNSGVTASSLTSVGTLTSDLNMGGQDVISAGVSSADTHAGIYGSSSAPVEFTVTVGTKTAAHPYYGDGSSSAYFINGVESPALTLHGVDNVTSNSEYYYRFTLSSSDMSSHPFRLYLDADKTTAYTTGVTTTSTYLQIAVNEDTPNILYYQCSSHAYMGNHAIVLGSNKINHTEALLSFPTTTGTLVGTGDTGSVSNTMLAGSIANDKLAGSIANAKLANSSINFGGISLALGASDTTPAFDLTDATNYPTSSLSGTITNAQLAGSIANSKLANDSVSFGGVSVDLGASDATPAFDLADATNYPTSSLSGTITNAQLAGSIAASKLAGSIGDSLLSTISTAGKVALSALEIDGASDIGEDLVNADLIIVDNGAGGTEVKSELTRVKKYIYSAMSGDATASDAGAVTIANDAVEQAMIADDAVGADQLASDAVVTASIVDDNVTQEKIADDAVGADQLASNAVVNASVASGAAIAFSKMENLTTGRALVSDGSGDVSVATTTSTEIGYVNGVTSAIQTQIDAAASKGFATAMAIAL